MLAPEVNYQTIVSTMDTVRSFKAVVAANLVDAELFPQISLGDAPELAFPVNSLPVHNNLQADEESSTGDKL